jgi:hypothetical protein
MVLHQFLIIRYVQEYKKRGVEDDYDVELMSVPKCTMEGLLAVGVG